MHVSSGFTALDCLLLWWILLFAVLLFDVGDCYVLLVSLLFTREMLVGFDFVCLFVMRFVVSFVV